MADYIFSVDFSNRVGWDWLTFFLTVWEFDWLRFALIVVRLFINVAQIHFLLKRRKERGIGRGERKGGE